MERQTVHLTHVGEVKGVRAVTPNAYHTRGIQLWDVGVGKRRNESGLGDIWVCLLLGVRW